MIKPYYREVAEQRGAPAHSDKQRELAERRRELTQLEKDIADARAEGTMWGHTEETHLAIAAHCYADTLEARAEQVRARIRGLEIRICDTGASR